jgi:DNA end-binding protein Ku
MAKKTGTRSTRPIWSGSINFGLVTIPVKLFTAVREKRLSFRSLHDQDKQPLKQKLYCPADGKEVHPEHIVKGFEIEKNQFVVVKQSELDAAAPKATKSIEIVDFVELAEIDPIYFDRPYYVAPKPEGAKPYRLLLDAMAKTKKVGIAKFVMHNKEYLAALRPLDADTLCLETMHFSDEVVSETSIPEVNVKAKVDEREMKVAQQLIDSLTAKFDLSKYHDEYREEVMAMINRKAKGDQVVSRPQAEEKPHKTHDLMAALQASLSSSRSSATHNDHTRTSSVKRRKSA